MSIPAMYYNGATVPNLLYLPMLRRSKVSGYFKRIEPPQTFSNHIIADIAQCEELLTWV